MPSHMKGSHGGSLFCTKIKFDRQDLSSFSQELSWIPVETNWKSVRRTGFLWKRTQILCRRTENLWVELDSWGKMQASVASVIYGLFYQKIIEKPCTECSFKLSFLKLAKLGCRPNGPQIYVFVWSIFTPNQLNLIKGAKFTWAVLSYSCKIIHSRVVFHFKVIISSIWMEPYGKIKFSSKKKREKVHDYVKSERVIYVER